MRVTVGSDTLLPAPTFVGGDEEAATPDGAPTVGIASATGDDGWPATLAVSADAGGHAALVPAATWGSRLLEAKVSWAATVGGLTRVESREVLVVDGHYASVPELRAHPDLADVSLVPTVALLAARDAFAGVVEKARGTSWVGRAATATLDQHDRWRVRQLHVRSVDAVVVDGHRVADDELAGWSIDPTGQLHGPRLPRCGLVTVHYSYGLASPIEQLREACREYVRETVLAAESGIPRNALSWADGQGGTYRTSTADWEAGRFTGFMSVDRLLHEADDHRIPRFW